VNDHIQKQEEMNQLRVSQSYPSEPLGRDADEINLIDLVLVVLKRKWFIAGLVFFTGVAALIITLLMTDIYRSEATILPREEEKTTSSMVSSALGGLGGMVAGELGLGGGGSLEKLQVVLESRYLAQRVIEKYDLLPTLFPDSWDETEKKWKIEKKWFGLQDTKPPTLQSGIKKLAEGLLGVTSDIKMGTIKVSFEDKDPEKAKLVVEYFITEMSETMREVELRDASENMKFFNSQLERTTDPLLRTKIYEMLAREIEKDTFARAQKHYGFYVSDPPLAPDLDKKASPRRALIVIVSVFLALFLSVFLVFSLEYLSRLKTEDQDRYRQLKEGLWLLRRKPKP